MELLRRGPITTEQLEAFGEVVIASPGQRPEAPGQLPSHYAPGTPLRFIEDPFSFSVPSNKKCGLLAWSSVTSPGQFAEIRQLSPDQNLREAAANLFRYLRELDQLDLDLIVAEQLPEEGLGAAINDRLRRAAYSALMRQAGLNESLEKRMRLVRLALEFRVILAGEKIGVIPQLDQFRERSVR